MVTNGGREDLGNWGDSRAYLWFGVAESDIVGREEGKGVDSAVSGKIDDWGW